LINNNKKLSLNKKTTIEKMPLANGMQSVCNRLGNHVKASDHLIDALVPLSKMSISGRDGVWLRKRISTLEKKQQAAAKMLIGAENKFSAIERDAKKVQAQVEKKMSRKKQQEAKKKKKKNKKKTMPASRKKTKKSKSKRKTASKGASSKRKTASRRASRK
jgi:hypothetical protein